MFSKRESYYADLDERFIPSSGGYLNSLVNFVQPTTPEKFRVGQQVRVTTKIVGSWAGAIAKIESIGRKQPPGYMTYPRFALRRVDGEIGQASEEQFEAYNPIEEYFAQCKERLL